MNFDSSKILVPLELDYLVNTLRSPGPSVTVQNVLGYLYNYLPYVKHEHNLKIVIASFLNNPVCFGSKVPDYEENYLIIEPTLPVRTFYNVIAKELQHFVAFNPKENSWKVLPIIAGITLCKETRDQLLPNFIENWWFFRNFDSSMHSLFVQSFQIGMSYPVSSDVTDLALISLALKFRLTESLHQYFGALDSRVIILRLISLIYGPKGGAQIYKLFESLKSDADMDKLQLRDVFQLPSVKHLNRLSLLLEMLFQQLSHALNCLDVVLQSMNMMMRFDEDLSQFADSHEVFSKEPAQSRHTSDLELQFWTLMKSILFSQVIIFQGILTRFVRPKGAGLLVSMLLSGDQVARMENEYREVCLSILHCLCHLNFILLTVGQGGFEGYNFIYYVSLEIIFHNSMSTRFEESTSLMIDRSGKCPCADRSIKITSQTANCFTCLVCGRIIYSCLPSKTRRLFNMCIHVRFEIASDRTLHDPRLTEAGHSVLLAYFSAMENTVDNLRKVLTYFELLAVQFPQHLSAHQLSVAVETLGKKIMTNSIQYENSYYKSSIDEFLHFVYIKCLNTVPGQPIKNSKNVVFNSAQPVPEIEASSTISQLEKSSGTLNVFEENKGEKPKDLSLKDIFSGTEAEASEQFGIRVSPNTSREGFIVALLNVVPYLPLSIFVHWLSKIWSLIIASNKNEQKFLIDRMWKCLSENLDLNRCEVAYDWWFETIRAAEVDIGHQPTLFKL
ncbi:hypothetical protein HF325_000959 [Metschnikowia pulcherrima]|uniref:Uncharacterized protein n=1 Tax=Metschnikowia pulcherrima TaxID=27326 RepID=A0A8H7LHX8_9ASCO|nr:hypothetical protein HF325_000959 [Metschnikowia pulcherrima]